MTLEELKPGTRVRLRPGLENPRWGWVDPVLRPEALETGTVKRVPEIAGGPVLVDFPCWKGWMGAPEEFVPAEYGNEEED